MTPWWRWYMARMLSDSAGPPSRASTSRRSSRCAASLPVRPYRRTHSGPSALVASPTTKLRRGDVLLGVGTAQNLDDLQKIVGTPAEIDVRKMPSKVATRRLWVTRANVTEKALRDLDIWHDAHLTFTRVRRLELEFAATKKINLVCLLSVFKTKCNVRTNFVQKTLAKIA